MFGKLLQFLDIDADERAAGVALSDLLTPHFERVIDDFYTAVQKFDINPHVTAATVPILKIKQKQHWMALFHSRFDDAFFASVTRIGVRHRDIGLNPMWYVAGYSRLKLAFTEIIVRSDFHVARKGHMLKTLEKFIAVDMALAVSAYDAVIVD